MTMTRRPALARLSTEKRFASVGGAPRTFDLERRTVDAILSKGSPVDRTFGTERLLISKQAVNLSRLETSGIPLLDSHEQRGISNALGRLVRIWIDGGTLNGRLKFAETSAGEQAMAMVSRGEITAISIGYIVRSWEITDHKGRVLDPEADRIPMDGSLEFTAVRWDLLEASLVSVPADDAAMIRSMGGESDRLRFLDDVRARMRARQNMHDRMRGWS